MMGRVYVIGLSLAVLFTACSTDSTVGPGPTADGALAPPEIQSIDTLLSTETLRAGESLEYTCVDQDGATISNEAVVVHVEGPESLILKHGTFTPTVSGGYALRCGLLGTEVIDLEPAFVQVDAGLAATAETEVDPEWVKAGESTKVTCSFEDNYGNKLLSAGKFKVAPEQSVTLAGATFKATAVGTYQVRCFDPETGVEDQSPALVFVVPELPKRLK